MAKVEKHKIKPITITGVIAISWTTLAIIAYSLLRKYCTTILTVINNILNYIWDLIPKWLLLWFIIPLLIVYIYFICKGILGYSKKAIDFKKKTNTKKDKQVQNELTDQEMQELASLAKDNNVPTALLFRKLVRKAQKDLNNLYVVKSNEMYWLTICDDDQFKRVQKYAKELNQSLTKQEFPQIVQVDRKHIESFDKKAGQEAFKKSLEKGDEA